MDRPGEQLSSLAKWTRDIAFELNFYRVHLLFFVVSILVSSAIFWASNTNAFHVEYVDALTMCASAMTGCGLNTVNLGSVNAYQQSMLFVLMLLGDLSVASSSVVYVRRYFFGKKIRRLLRHSRAAQRLAEDIEHQREHRNVSGIAQATCTSASSSAVDHPQARLSRVNSQGVDRQSQQPPEQQPAPTSRRVAWTSHGYGGLPLPWQTDAFRRFTRLPSRLLDNKPVAEHHYLSFDPELDHKGRFSNLSSAQLEELGGVEYRALCVLSWLLPAYTLFWLCISWVILLPYTTKTSVSSVIQSSQAGNTNPQWWAFFTGMSSYSNCGLSLLNQSMIPFRHDYLILIITGTVILAGNTFYPILLRLTLWILSKIAPKHSRFHHSLAFLLHHPRRCFLFLLPAKYTWYLAGVQALIFLLLWLAFEVLNLGYGPLDSDLSDSGLRAMDGLYQAHGVRSSGFYITNQSNLSPACQIFFMVNMYISAIPFIISLRSTNVYEERSVGMDDNSKKISGDEASDSSSGHSNRNAGKGSKADNKSQRLSGAPSIQTHLQNQLAYDLWWIVLAVWLIAIIERSPLAQSAPGFSLFSIVFEVVSAYGTVGLSLGSPYNSTSFCGAWQKLSKLILITVMLRGRHRILPLAVDRAVLIPGQQLMDRLDQEDTLDASEDGDAVYRTYEEEIRKEEEGEQAEHGGRQDPECGDERDGPGAESSHRAVRHDSR